MAVSPAHGVQCGGDAHKGTHAMFIFEPHVLYYVPTRTSIFACRGCAASTTLALGGSRTASLVPVSNNNIPAFLLIPSSTETSATFDATALEEGAAQSKKNSGNAFVSISQPNGLRHLRPCV